MPQCEFIEQEGPGCTDVADYEITDLADYDPTTCIANACTDHVTDMLGHHASLPGDCRDEWRLRYLHSANAHV